MAEIDAHAKEKIMEFLAEQVGRESAEAGCLYIVGTPIGNLGDLSPRSISILASCSRIAAEDTRRSGQLLHMLGISKPFISYHEHNIRSRGPEIVALLQDGESVALVSDAGMPAISDPGEDLVRLCRDAGLPVRVIPGPNAAVSALAVSGMPSRRFSFFGFLPAHGKPRREALDDLVSACSSSLRMNAGDASFILYEAPHRLRKTLEDLAARGLGAYRLTISRELTKRFEDYHGGTVSELLTAIAETELRGELVLILAPPVVRSTMQEQASEKDGMLLTLDAAEIDSDDWWNAAIDERLAKGERVSAVVRELITTERPLGVDALTRNELYARVMERRDRV